MTNTTSQVVGMPYRQVSISGSTLADPFRGAADWLDQAAKNLGEVLQGPRVLFVRDMSAS